MDKKKDDSAAIKFVRLLAIGCGAAIMFYGTPACLYHFGWLQGDWGGALATGAGCLFAGFLMAKEGAES